MAGRHLVIIGQKSDIYPECNLSDGCYFPEIENQ